MMTYGDLVDRLIELGIAPSARRTELAALLDDEVADVDGAVLADVGVAVYLESLDGREVGSAYESVIKDAAALSGGAVVITDVAFDREARTGQLSFRINGRPVTWSMDAHGPGDWIYSWSAIWGQMHMLAPGGDDPRDFYTADGADDTEGDVYLLLTREQADALREEFGLDLDTVPFIPDRPPTARP